MLIYRLIRWILVAILSGTPALRSMELNGYLHQAFKHTEGMREESNTVGLSNQAKHNRHCWSQPSWADSSLFHFHCDLNGRFVGLFVNESFPGPTVPPELYDLTDLEQLDLAKCHLTELSPKIAQLQNLRELVLNNNHLRSIPAEIGSLSSLIYLDLFSNGLRRVPPEFGNLHNLKMVLLNHNELTELPTEIGNLVSLEDLYLSRNNLTSLPASMGKLKRLQRLEMKRNEISALPPELLALEKQNGLNFSREMDIAREGMQWSFAPRQHNLPPEPIRNKYTDQGVKLTIAWARPVGVLVLLVSFWIARGCSTGWILRRTAKNKHELDPLVDPKERVKPRVK